MKMLLNVKIIQKSKLITKNEKMQRKQSRHYLNVITTRHTTPAVVSQGPHALYLT